jgi:hypothetical protein
MLHDADRTIAVLAKALAVCRGMLYSARTGDAHKAKLNVFSRAQDKIR